MAVRGDEANKNRKRIDPLLRFAPKFTIKPNGCWEWHATKTHDGYGMFWFNGIDRVAHKWWWEQCYGPVASGLELDHLCRNRACVNLTHLEPVTPIENKRRSPLINKTHCKHGHEFNSDNIYFYAKRTDSNGSKRVCKICIQNRSIRYNQEVDL